MAKEKKDVEKKVCEKCGGRQFILTDEGPVPCECRQAELLKKRLKAAKIPSRYKNKTIKSFISDDPQRKKLHLNAEAYVKGFSSSEIEMKKGLLFMGDTGCGKTHLAVGILKNIIEKGFKGYFYNIADFIARLRDTMGGDADYDEMDLLEEISKVDFLVLDDLGTEKPTEWVLDRLYTLINLCYERNLPVVVTTNKMDIIELENHVGKRIVSRLCEMCQIIDNFPKEDYRKKDLEVHSKSVRKENPHRLKTGQ